MPGQGSRRAAQEGCDFGEVGGAGGVVGVVAVQGFEAEEVPTGGFDAPAEGGGQAGEEGRDGRLPVLGPGAGVVGAQALDVPGARGGGDAGRDLAVEALGALLDREEAAGVLFDGSASGGRQSVEADAGGRHGASLFHGGWCGGFGRKDVQKPPQLPAAGLLAGGGCPRCRPDPQAGGPPPG